MKLSSVLEDVGLSEKLVLKRNRTTLLQENMKTIITRLNIDNMSVYFFGSQSEGTTTLGLDSYVDMLYCDYDWNVIEDWADWRAGHGNLKMIQDENVSPGYCMLQVLYPNVPLPLTEILDEHHVKLREDMVVLKNTLFDNVCRKGFIKNGPSFTSSRTGFNEMDSVVGLHCRKMPHVVANWIQTQMSRGKLSLDMKTYIESNPCFVVAVGNKESSHECLEWRISTSHAERCIMFNLNITQKRCYVMMKMILKSFLKGKDEKGLTSFMCKNILLLCIEKTPSESWCSSNLLKMFTLCLVELQKCIINKQCPHFIERRNNLMYRKFSHNMRIWLLEQVRAILHSNGRALLEITTDDVGHRLQLKLNWFNEMVHSTSTATSDKKSRDISGRLMFELARRVTSTHSLILQELSLGNKSRTDIDKILARFSNHDNTVAQEACRLLQPFLYSDFGCFLASSSLQRDDVVSPDALDLLRDGMNSDVASGRLKLASVYYAVGDFDSVYGILRSTEETYDTELVEAVCECNDISDFYHSGRFDVYADSHNELSVRDITASFVRFVPREINCIPRELQYELFRSSQDDLLHRDKDGFWMDWAVVDSLPFLYFLQYKTFGHLRRPGDQQYALGNLIAVAQKQDANFGHRETAWNLAGQCMEQEGWPVDAFQCYLNSLNIRPRNNAAIFHICKLLYHVISSQNLK